MPKKTCAIITFFHFDVQATLSETTVECWRWNDRAVIALAAKVAARYRPAKHQGVRIMCYCGKLL